MRDDGPGFDLASTPRGFGIGEILGRQLEAVGGHGVVDSAPGRGTEVRIIFPASAVMTAGPPVLPLASADEPVRYVIIDDEPRYRQGLGAADGARLVQVGGYGSVDDFICIQREPCHVVVLDLCLNRQTGDKAVLQGVLAIRQLTGRFGHRVLVYSADPRPEPVARCVAAGAAGFVDKYNDEFGVLAQAVDEIGRNGHIVTGSLHNALRQAGQDVPRCPSVGHAGRDPRPAGPRHEGRRDRQATLPVRQDD